MSDAIDKSKLTASKRRMLREVEALKQAKKDIKEEASQFGYLALLTLVEICQDGDTDAVRVSAASALLDRGFGKPVQGISSPGGLTVLIGADDSNL